MEKKSNLYLVYLFMIIFKDYFPAKLNTIFILRPQSYFQRVLSSLLFQEDHINGTVNYTFNHSSNSPNSKNKSPLNVSQQYYNHKQIQEFSSSLINLNRRKPEYIYNLYVYYIIKKIKYLEYFCNILYFYNDNNNKNR